MVLHRIVPFRRGAPITTVKHVVDSEGSLVAGTVSINAIAFARNVRQDPYQPVDVLTGSKITSVYISLFIIGDTGAPIVGSLNWYIDKRHQGQSTDFPDPGNTGVSMLRNQIFHEEKGLAGSGDGTPMAFKGVIRIPRGMQRMREGDALDIRILTNAVGGAQFCLKVIYKEWT